MSYSVKFYKGDYITRQRAANADKAIVYIEHHFNSVENQSADYTCVVVGSNAGRISREFGQAYAARISASFGCKIGGVNGLLIGGFNGRGDGNVKHTDMPAALLEPLFCSNPKRAAQIKSIEGQVTLATAIADTVRAFFPNGGLVAFSVGHKYRTSKPRDLGAPVHGGGHEAEYAEFVLNRAAELLQIKD